MPQQQLQMIWPEGKPAPEVHAPAGYEVRPLRPGDEPGHVRVMLEAGFSGWNEQKLAGWRDLHALPDGISVAVETASGRVAATAMACHKPRDLHPCGGELGYVAASPAHAGKGLGRAVCAAVVRRLADAGYRRIFLLTDDHRLAAIKTYLKLGFVPFLFAGDMEARWRDVCERLGWSFDPAACARAPKDQWIAEPPEARPDKDRLARYAKRRKWLPDRPHRGFSSNGDADAFGDESLYRPSRLGRARAEPSEVEAGARSPLRIVFTAGEEGIPEGATVNFVMRGQRPLGTLPEPSVSGPPGCGLRIAEKSQGFVVEKGTLRQGDTVTLDWPEFTLTPLAGRREFKVVLAYAEDVPERRLPEPTPILVRPMPLSRLEATLPCTHTPGREIEARVTSRDEHDNRAPHTGEVQVDTPAGARQTTLAGGIATLRLRPAADGPTRVSVASQAAPQPVVSNPSVPAKGRQVFVGDLHCHDFMSEAEGYPDEVYRWAIEDRKLDFISVVPQAHGWLDNETWTVAKYMNERFLDEGRFVTLLGFEWQHTGYGDKVIHYLGGDQPYLPHDDPRYRTPAGLYAALRGSDALAISHHPCYPPDSWCGSTDFDTVETDVERLVEIWSMHGSCEGYDPCDRPLRLSDPTRTALAALRRGLRLGFTGGSDTHSARPGGSAKEPRPHWGGLTGVWADGLTRRDLFRALRERRTYALTNARIVLGFEVNGLPMGSEGEASEGAGIRIEAWAPGEIAKVELLKNAALLRAFEPGQDACRIETEDKPGGPAFYHCRVTLADGNLAVCSPVWLG